MRKKTHRKDVSAKAGLEVEELEDLELLLAVKKVLPRVVRIPQGIFQHELHQVVLLGRQDELEPCTRSPMLCIIGYILYCIFYILY